MKTLRSIVGLTPAADPGASNVVKERAGSKAPLTLGESVIHAAADAALDRLNGVLGVSPQARDAFLQGSEGRALRNVLRRYVMHANASAMEAET